MGRGIKKPPTKPEKIALKDWVQELISEARSYLGRHEDGSSNRAAWLDPIQKKAGLLGQAWCALIIFYEWIPAVEERLGIKSKLIPSAGVRKAAQLNAKHLHADPRPGDVGFLGTINSWTGHCVLVIATGSDIAGQYYVCIEGNTRADNPRERNGGEVAIHKRYLNNKSDGFEELGFATPF